MKRAIIVHGWASHDQDGWFPWLKRELESRGFQVDVPNMPFPRFPIPWLWIRHIKKLARNVDQETVFIGHSIGCQAILRFMETQSHPIKGAVFVAGFFKLERAETLLKRTMIAHWLHHAWDTEKLRRLIPKSIAIFSDNDRRVPLQENRHAFQEKLRSEIVIDHNKKHFAGKQGILELPSALEAVLRLYA